MPRWSWTGSSRPTSGSKHSRTARAKEDRVKLLTEQHEAAQAAVATAAVRLAVAKASLADTRVLIDRTRVAVAEEAALTAATAPVAPPTSAPGKAIVATVVDLPSAALAVQELDNLRNQIGAIVAAAVAAGERPPSVGPEAAVLDAADRKAKRLKAEGKAGEAKAKEANPAPAALSQAESVDSMIS